jgi:ATP-dependent DNA ligase
MEIPNEALVRLVSKINVMKPNTVKDDNAKQLIKLNALLDSNDYEAEDKIDGCHYIMVGCRYFSTDHIEKTDNYPLLRDFFVKLGMPNLILDGEINYPGKTSQFVTHVTGAEPDAAIAFQQDNGYIHYTIWDILRTPKGTWVINEPLYKRRQILNYLYEHYIKGTSMEQYIHLTQWTEDNKREFKDAILAAGGEGIVLKQKNSLYVMGKKPAWMWIKIKQKDTTDLFISGYEAPTIIYSGRDFDSWPYWKKVEGQECPVTKFYYMGWIGALELSAYVNGKVTKICTCSGLEENLRKEISEHKDKYLNRVVKITFMEKTEAGYPRHPRFVQFHESKTADECTWNF